MDYEEFVTEFSETLQSQLPEGSSTERIMANKINGDRDALVIAYAASPVRPTVYLDEKYELYGSGIEMIEIVEQVVAQLKFAMENLPHIPELNYESANKNLYATVINAEMNEKILEKAPHEKIEDLAIVARYRVDDTGSFLVTNNICNELKMTAEEVMSIARANIEKEEFVCRSMTDVMRSMMLMQGMSSEEIDDIFALQGGEQPMYVLSAPNIVEGAVAMTSSTAMNIVAEQIQEDFYILPSSRYEVIILPKSVVEEPEGLMDMVKEINETNLKPEERLSDNVYLYHINEKKLTMVGANSVSKAKEMPQQKQATKIAGRCH